MHARSHFCISPAWSRPRQPAKPKTDLSSRLRRLGTCSLLAATRVRRCQRWRQVLGPVETSGSRSLKKCPSRNVATDTLELVNVSYNYSCRKFADGIQQCLVQPTNRPCRAGICGGVTLSQTSGIQVVISFCQGQRCRWSCVSSR